MEQKINLKKFFIPMLCLSICAIVILLVIHIGMAGNNIQTLQKSGYRSDEVFFRAATEILGSLVALSIPAICIAASFKIDKIGWAIYMVAASSVGFFASLAMSASLDAPYEIFFSLLLTLVCIPGIILSIIQLFRISTVNRLERNYQKIDDAKNNYVNIVEKYPKKETDEEKKDDEPKN